MGTFTSDYQALLSDWTAKYNRQIDTFFSPFASDSARAQTRAEAIAAWGAIETIRKERRAEYADYSELKRR